MAISKENVDLASLSPEEKRQLLAELIAAKNVAADNITADKRFALSDAQRRLWFIEKLQAAQQGYKLPIALRFKGRLDLARLNKSLNQVIARHEILRTRFEEHDGEPWAVVTPEVDIQIPVIDAANASDRDIEDKLQSLQQTPFDLSQAPLLRGELLVLGSEHHVLLISVHHIVADYASLRILLRDTLAFYASESSLLPALDIQYLDYAAWQNEQAESLQQDLAYWQQALAGAPPLLDLPTDFPRPPRQTFEGGRVPFALSPSLSEAVEIIAAEHQTTPFTVILSALAIVLSRYAGEDDVCIGTIVDNRDREQTRQLIGPFVNNLVLRTQVTGGLSFDELLRNTHETVLNALSHQQLPFEQVVTALDVERQLAYNALFQVSFVLHTNDLANNAERMSALSGLEVSGVDIYPRGSRFDLSLDLTPSATGLSGFFEYRSDLFHASTIEQLGRRLQQLLESAAASPRSKLTDLRLLTDLERNQYKTWNDTDQTVAPTTVVEQILRTATDYPEKYALSAGDTTLSYADLTASVVHWQSHLKKAGVRQGHSVAICLPRGIDLVVALLATLRLGAHYVPLDPSHPAARRQAALSDCAAQFLITDHADCTVESRVIGTAALGTTADPGDWTDEVNVGADDLAYIIYTSGSTGEPKGVPIHHHSLLNIVEAMALAPGITAEDVFLSVTTFAFDIATLELLLPLYRGAHLVIADEDETIDGAALAQQIHHRDITKMQATPATWRLLIEEQFQAPANFCAWSGGEALDFDLAQSLIGAGCEVWNLYGPTEATIWSSALSLTADTLSHGIVPIGGPVQNTQFFVIDSHQTLCPPGVPGELYIGGAGLSEGYVNRPDKTAAAFVEASPEVRALGITGMLYRTGDRARWRDDGTLELFGRRDNQIKLRGFRIELGEIETIAAEVDEVAEAVATLRGENEQAFIALYCTRKSASAEIQTDKRSAEDAIRQHLLTHLPRYMVPAWIAVLDKLPLNANGKIDRKALPAPQSHVEHSEPLATETEKSIATIWSRLLEREITNRDANFFHLGGHSLTAARSIAALQAEFSKAVPLAAVFERPRLQDFASYVDSLSPEQDSAPAPLIIDALEPVMTRAQQRLWVLAKLDPSSTAYHLPAAIELNSALNPALLEKAVQTVWSRHDVLHQSFKEEDGWAAVEYVAQIRPEIEWLKISADEASLQARIREAINLPFDLSAAPLVRLSVFTINEDHHMVLLVAHHIVIDAESLQILFRELIDCYQALSMGKTPVFKPLQSTYGAYAARESEHDIEPSLNYWHKQLEALPASLELPLDYARGLSASNGDIMARDSAIKNPPGEVRFQVSAEKRRKLESLAQQSNATLFMVILAAFKLLLARYSQSSDIIVGTPAMQRPSPDLEGVVGLFVNTLALRTDLSKCANFQALITAIQATVVAGLAHSDAPFEAVINSLDVPRDWAREPIFQVMFVWRHENTLGTDSTQQFFSPYHVENTETKFDLSLTVGETRAGLAGRLEYHPELYHPSSMQSLINSFASLLDAVAEDANLRLNKLSLLSQTDAARLRTDQYRRLKKLSADCLHDRIATQAAQSPNTRAVTDGVNSLTYAALIERSDEIAAALKGAGVGLAQHVAVCLPRSTELIASLLGILKLGASYVPIDPTYPTTRQNFILEDSKATALLTNNTVNPLEKPATCRALFLEEIDSSAATIKIHKVPSETTAYVIYTSGSTGTPKGVSISHRAAVALLDWAQETYSDAELSGVYAGTSICFDLSIFEIFVPLASGGTVIVGDNALAISNHPDSSSISLINTVPSAAAAMLRQGIPQSVTTINIAGEPLPPSLVNDLYARPHVDRVYNLYGPSEDTTYSTGALMVIDEPGASSPIGLPLADARAYVLDEQLNEVPPGMPGELYLAGPGVARGYFGRPGLTAARFLPDPFARRDTQTDDITNNQSLNDPVMYYTGDRVRFRHDGKLEYLGRVDQQLKIRGYRIEPGEIEATLVRLPDVTEAAVRAWPMRKDQLTLVAYVTTNPATEITQDLAADSELAMRWRDTLSTTLPNFMLPSMFVLMATLPKLPNGKIARQNLPKPDVSEAPRKTHTLSAPETAMQQIWTQVLGVEHVGPNDNFFALGGDSILAIQVIARANDAGFDVEPRQLFEHPSVAGLVAAAGTLDDADEAQTTFAGPLALTPAQQWFFAQPLVHRAHWNQAVLLNVDFEIDETRLKTALTALESRHDMLRARFTLASDGWQQIVLPPSESVPLSIIRERTSNVARTLEDIGNRTHAEFNLADSSLWAVVYAELDTSNGVERRLLIVCHHLIVDGVSWRILLDDLRRLYQLANAGSSLPRMRPAASIQQYFDYLRDKRPELLTELDYWRQIEQAQIRPLPRDGDDNDNLMAFAATLSNSLSIESTEQLLREVPRAFPIRVEEILLAGLVMALEDWSHNQHFRVELESHGRGDQNDSNNFSSTIAWMTALYPVLISAPKSREAGDYLHTIKSQLRAVPNSGIGYGFLRFNEQALAGNATEFRFNYLGQTDNLFSQQGFSPAGESSGRARHKADPRDTLLDVNALITRDKLTLHWTYNTKSHSASTVSSLLESTLSKIHSLIEYCLNDDSDTRYVESDFPQMNFADGELEDLIKQL
ncbi:MAG: amino acid adenylation domain-containing protein [Pseudomonadota bacterium]